MMSGNNLLGNFFFYEYGGYKSAQLYVNNGSSGEMAEFRPGQIVTTCRRIADVSHMIECEMSDSLHVRNNNTNKSVYISEDKIQFYDNQTYTGWTGTVDVVTNIGFDFNGNIDTIRRSRLFFKAGIIYNKQDL